MTEYKILDAILKDSTFGYTCNRIILDDAGKPVDYVFLDVNEAYARMIGKTRDGIIGRRVTEVIPGLDDDSFPWIECFGRVALTGEKVEFEEFSNSVNRWFRLSITSPEPLYFVGVSFDITDKKRMELDLERSEELNRRYVDDAPDAIIVCDENGKYLKVNPAATRILGYSERELLGMDITTMMPERLYAKTIEAFTQLKRKGFFRKVTWMKHKAGNEVEMAVDAVPLPDNQFMWFCKDMTEDRRVRGEKDRYFNVFSSIAQPILITGPEGNILAVNDAFTSMYGYARDEVIGQNPRVLNPGLDVYRSLGYSIGQYRDVFRALWTDVTAPSCGRWEGVVINRRKNGSLVWVNLFVSASFDEKGKIASILGFPVDITVRHELEDKNRILLYQTIADLAELRDDETGNHIKRVGIFARLLSKELGMNPKFCSDIEIFAPMHDIGKVGILDSILRAPRTLTAEEFEIMKSHTLLGHNIVKGKKELEIAAEITLCHHERWDGTGYPNHIEGGKIPVSAQITSLCDVYDALRSHRPYKQPWTHEKACACIEEGSGTQFCPDVVRAFTSLETEFEDVYGKLVDLR